MLLSTAAILVGGGLVVWILGLVFERRELVAIGAVLVLGTGATLTNGLDVRTGQQVDKQYGEVNGSTVVVNETISAETRPVDLPQRLGLGSLVMLLGGLGTMHALEPPE